MILFLGIQLVGICYRWCLELQLSRPDRAPWRLAAIRRGLCILGARHGVSKTKVALSGLEIHRRLKRFYGKLRTATGQFRKLDEGAALAGKSGVFFWFLSLQMRLFEVAVY